MRPMFGVAVHAVIVDSGMVLLGRRTIEPMLGQYCCPGGHMEHGEQPYDAVRRELYEEAGRTAVKVSPLAPFSTSTDGKNYVHLPFLCTSVSKPISQADGTWIDPVWVGVDNDLELTNPTDIVMSDLARIGIVR